MEALDLTAGSVTIVNMALALVMTIISELLAYLIFLKKRTPTIQSSQWVLLIIGMNCITNPLVQLVCYGNYWFSSALIRYIAVELCVMMAEGALLNVVLSMSMKRALMYSIILNMTSIVTGELLWYFDFWF